jgi:hypothetical protein
MISIDKKITRSGCERAFLFRRSGLRYGHGFGRTSAREEEATKAIAGSFLPLPLPPDGRLPALSQMESELIPTKNSNGDEAVYLMFENGWQINLILLPCGHQSYLAIPSIYAEDEKLFAAYFTTMLDKGGADRVAHGTDEELINFAVEIAKRPRPTEIVAPADRSEKLKARKDLN